MVDKKRLKFHPDLVPLIVNGSKITTWRLFDDKNLQIGDELILVNSKTTEDFSNAKIVLVNETTFEKLTPKDWAGHEKFSSPEEMYKSYSKYYGCAVDQNSLLKIIKYELI